MAFALPPFCDILPGQAVFLCPSHATFLYSPVGSVSTTSFCARYNFVRNVFQEFQNDDVTPAESIDVNLITATPLAHGIAYHKQWVEVAQAS